MLRDFFSNLIHDFSNWGIGQIFSIVLTLVIIIISLPFTYIGYSIRKAIEFKIKKYEGYGVKKIKMHAIVSTSFLFVIEILLYVLLDISKFYGITFIIILMVILGSFGIKVTFSLEAMLDNWIEDIFNKD